MYIGIYGPAVDFKHFVVHPFYDERTCFCWNEDKLAVFKYVTGDSESVLATVLTAPQTIKEIQCYSDRIFVICVPQGIYKLSRDLQFSVLSQAAIGMGAVFYEVLKPRNRYLYADNKQNKMSNPLFQFSSGGITSVDLCTYPITVDDMEEQFRKVMTETASSEDNFCLLANEGNLFLLANKTVQLTYNSTYSITGILPVCKGSKVAGFLLLTDSDLVIVMYSKEDKFVFENLSIRTTVNTISASFSERMPHTLLIVYSHESKLHYVKKQLSTDSIRRIEVGGEKDFVCLQCYDSKKFLGLTRNSQLLEISTETVEAMFHTESDVFVNLHSNMLKGTEVIMDKIYGGTQELQHLNEAVLVEEDKLRRINLYANNQSVRACPKILIHKMLNESYISASFHDLLPKNSSVIFSAESECDLIFCMKKTVDSDTTVELHIPRSKSQNYVGVCTDLVALSDQGNPWCIIKDYVKDPPLERNRKRRSKVDRSGFINAKISLLQSLIDNGVTDMKKLSDIKRNFRKECCDT